MSIHIGAKAGEVAQTVLLPGDPLRAKYIAEQFLEDVQQYNQVRGMLGYTGTYQGKRISVQGTGMGLPSLSIYVHELINDYQVQNLIRVGTCGAIQQNINVRDVILAMSASTNSSFCRTLLKDIDYAPTANFDLLLKAHEACQTAGVNPRVGNVFATDIFYNDNPDSVKQWAEYGVLALEMETTALYTLAAKFQRKALTILTVSDHALTGASTTAAERETSLNEMIAIALDTASKA